MAWIVGTIGLAIVVMTHLFVVLGILLKQDEAVNENIRISGGKVIGKDVVNHVNPIVQIGDCQMDTIVGNPVKPQVTSQFAELYIRLYQMNNGQYYDCCLRNQLIIGRSGGREPVDIGIDDSGVSQKHCRIYRQGELIIVQDLGSSNHTYINGCMVEGAVPITTGDIIQIGRNSFRFQCGI